MSNSGCTWVGCGLSLLAMHTAFAQPLFAPRLLADEAGLVGDFDGDGILDRLTSTAGSMVFRYLRGVGNGEFAAAVSIASPLPVGSSRPVVDLDGDGCGDAVFLSKDYSVTPYVIVVRGGPNGIASVSLLATAPDIYGSLLLGEFDGDGMIDGFVKTYGTGMAAIAKGDGMGGFALGAPFSLGSGFSFTMMTGDVDGDGDLDVVQSLSEAASSKGIGTFVNPGNGAPFTRVDFDPAVAGVSTYDLQSVADATGDARADVVVRRYGTNAKPQFVQLESTGVGTYLVKPAITYGMDALVINGFAWSADFDADGRADLLRELYLPQGVRYAAALASSASSGYTGTSVFQSFQLNFEHTLTDLDGDGTIDLLGNPVNEGLDSLYLADVANPIPRVRFDKTLGSPVTAGDFDGDGDIDLVTNGSTILHLGLRSNDGAGTFAAPIDGVTMSTSVSRYRAVDHDGDSRLDVVGLSTSGPRLFRNTALGVFVEGVDAPHSLTGGNSKLAIGDVTFDGRPDVVHLATGGFVRCAGTPLGFGAPTFFATSSPFPRDLAIGDVSGDGLMDVVCAETTALGAPGTVRAYLGHATAFVPGFGAAVGSDPGSLDVGDLDDDGLLDVAVISNLDHTIAVLRSTGSAFTPRQTLSFDSLLSSTEGRVRVADVTNDGRLDLVAVGTGLFVWVGLSDGSFAAAGHFAGGGSNELEIADFDLDGRVDLVTSEGPLVTRFGSGSALGAQKYGVGKPGAGGVPDLSATGAPLLGSSFGIEISNGLSGASPVLILGVAPAAIPFDLGTLWVSPVATLALPPFPTSGQLELGAAIAADPALVGLEIYAQAIFFDPQAGGFLHTAQSQGLRITFGS